MSAGNTKTRPRWSWQVTAEGVWYGTMGSVSFRLTQEDHGGTIGWPYWPWSVSSQHFLSCSDGGPANASSNRGDLGNQTETYPESIGDHRISCNNMQHTVGIHQRVALLHPKCLEFRERQSRQGVDLMPRFLVEQGRPFWHVYCASGGIRKTIVRQF